MLNTLNTIRRYPEIDTIKGIAVIFMVIFHYFYLSNFMNLSNYNINYGVLHYLAEISHNIFILMAGVNMGISYEKWVIERKKKKEFYKRHFIKFVKLLLAGLLITITTKYIFGDSIFVKFGIFHYVAISTLLSSLVISKKIYIILSIIGLLILSCYKCFKSPFLCFIMGIQNLKYSSLDHFSIIDYLPYSLFGIFIGRFFYKDNISKLPLKFTDSKILKPVRFLGKYSFNIYFVHFILFFIYFKVKGGIPKKTF